MLTSLPDPRPSPHDGAPHAVSSDVLAALSASAGATADAADRRIDAALAAALAQPDGAELAGMFAAAMPVDVHRHLWRRLAAQAQRPRVDAAGNGLAYTLFALPLVIVAARDSAAVEGAPTATVTLPATLADPAAVAALLREHGALGGNETLVVADTLATAEALAIAALPALYHAAAATVGGAMAPLAFPPRPIALGESEAVHLRFVVGLALSAPGACLLDDRSVGAWGMPMATLLSAMLGAPAASVLVLPRAPAGLPDAWFEGRRAQREVSAQLFAGNALRALRAAYGEPTAVLSAHRSADAEGGGELRVSLSSPFSPRDAEGFRCPLLPMERVGDVEAMLRELLRDCRVDDVRAIAGVQPDRDPATGHPLMFKPDSVAPPVLN